MYYWVGFDNILFSISVSIVMRDIIGLLIFLYSVFLILVSKLCYLRMSYEIFSALLFFGRVLYSVGVISSLNG